MSEDESTEAPARTLPEGWGHAAKSVSATYFWVFAAVGSFGPFAALYFRDLGFTGLEVGVLAALPALAVALSGPLWGSAADSLSAHRLVLRCSLAIAAALSLATTQVSTFPAVLLTAGSLAFALAPVASILDGYAVEVGERVGSSYGAIRVWGSVGYALSVFIVGRLMGDDVSRLFLVTNACFLLLAITVSAGIPRIGERKSRSLFGGLAQVRANPALAKLLVISYLISSATGIMYSFLGIRMEELGGSASIIGANMAIGVVSELPMIALGGWFLHKLGASRLIAIAIAVYAARLLAYGVITNPVGMLPVQAFHGLSYGISLTATVMLAHRLAGKENAATAQALLAAVSFGMGNITGSLIGGALLDTVGTAWLFRGAAVLMAATLVAFLIMKGEIDPGEAPESAPVELAPAV